MRLAGTVRLEVDLGFRLAANDLAGARGGQDQVFQRARRVAALLAQFP
jgi:hypothetical protein